LGRRRSMGRYGRMNSTRVRIMWGFSRTCAYLASNRVLDGAELAGSCQTGPVGHGPTYVGETTLSFRRRPESREWTLETRFLCMLAVRVMGYVRPALVFLDSGLRRNDRSMKRLEDLRIPRLKPRVGWRRISRGKAGCASLCGVTCRMATVGLEAAAER